MVVDCDCVMDHRWDHRCAHFTFWTRLGDTLEGGVEAAVSVMARGYGGGHDLGHGGQLNVHGSRHSEKKSCKDGSKQR